MSETDGNLNFVCGINDKSRGSIAKHLSCDELLCYKFNTR